MEVADLESLSYEQIIVDHEMKFTHRALWYAKRTLGLPVDTDVAPVAEKSAVQTRTAAFISWIRSVASANSGRIPTYANAAAAKAMGIDDTQKYGKVHGNIQSRIDYACLLSELPPIGLAAEHPFDKSWAQESRSWAFPVTDMRSSALARVWSDKDFTQILEQTSDLPGQAHLLWKSAFATRREAGVSKADLCKSATKPNNPPALTHAILKIIDQVYEDPDSLNADQSDKTVFDICMANPESEDGLAFGGVVPLWVSLINLTSFGCLIYGIIEIVFLG